MKEPRMQNCQPGILFLKGNRCLERLSLTLHIWGKPVTLLCLGRRGALGGMIKSLAKAIKQKENGTLTSMFLCLTEESDFEFGPWWFSFLNTAMQ